jgi:hypothetical protein
MGRVTISRRGGRRRSRLGFHGRAGVDRRHRGGGCNCSGKKKVKAYFCLFTFLRVGGVKPEDANVEVACWAQRSNGLVAAVEK